MNFSSSHDFYVNMDSYFISTNFNKFNFRRLYSKLFFFYICSIFHYYNIKEKENVCVCLCTLYEMGVKLLACVVVGQHSWLYPLYSRQWSVGKLQPINEVWPAAWLCKKCYIGTLTYPFTYELSMAVFTSR